MPSNNPFHQWINLEQPRLGTRVVYATDEFFAAKERLIDAAEPVFIADKFDDHGKWMDGWESRRRRDAGHDFCIIRLGVLGNLRGVDIDTRFFTGNFPPHASLEGCICDQKMPDDDTVWEEIISRAALQGDSHHWLPIDGKGPYTHIRFHIYPDGGVARLRLYGAVRPDTSRWGDDAIDLLALENGGRALICSDEHYGSMHNLNLPGRSLNMGDGWETARRRGPGNDWVIFALAAKGTVESVEIDTEHFKGNYPDRAAVDAVCLESPLGPAELVDNTVPWQTLLPESKLEMNQQHEFKGPKQIGPVTHVRMRIFPDGGVSRLRIRGRRVTS
ncbi:MAG: allantoicase [Gammaproteobacteria bacterium]|nr:allantoicase [Gammaproteobacteria bacterium]